jgi:hypothetical protein
MPMPTGRLMRQGPWGLPDWAWQALTHWGSPPQRSQIRGWPVSGLPRTYFAGHASAHFMHFAPRQIFSFRMMPFVFASRVIDFGVVGQAAMQGASSHCQQMTGTSTMSLYFSTQIRASEGRTLPVWNSEQASSQLRQPVQFWRPA